jgi:hypothetical protein
MASTLDLPAVVLGARLLLFWRLFDPDASLVAIVLVVNIDIVGEVTVLPLAIAVQEIAAEARRLVTTVALVTLSSYPTSLTVASATPTARIAPSSTHGRR